ncbi:MAG: hypothetical protein HYV41_00495, partial [Candidatus Magasanikbacteria bacterium]|nr:hypothetical protein [Candidatus Magasanikbacteria bacterium]
SAVRLIDEVFTQVQAGKVIWADAIQWLPVGDNPNDSEEEEQQPTLNPDLTLLSDSISITENISSILFIKKKYTYTITVDVHNNNTIASESASLCFNPDNWSPFNCQGNTEIGSIGPEETKKLSISFATLIKIDADPLGELKLSNVYPHESNETNNTLSIPKSALKSPPGGVDFSSAALSGLTVASGTKELQFIVKGEPALAGETVIDLDGEIDSMKKLFLQALAIPNHKQWISLDPNPEYFTGGELQLIPKTPTPFEKTDLAKIMFIADVYLKEFWDSQFRTEATQYWISLIKQDQPFWSSLAAKGFNNNIFCPSRAAIIHGDVTADATENSIAVQKSALGVESQNYKTCYVQDGPLPLSSLEVWQQTKLNDLVKQYSDWYTNFQLAHHDEMVLHFNTDPEYADLRQAYQIIALAHWYKTLPKENLPYADLIDSEKLEGIASEDPYTDDEIYSLWKSLSFDFVMSDFYGTETTYIINGGVSLGNVNTTVSGNLNTLEQQTIETLVETQSYIESNGEYYVYGGSLSSDRADLSIGFMSISPKIPTQDMDAAISASVINEGVKTSGSFVVSLYDVSTDMVGKETMVKLEEKTVTDVAAGDFTELTFTWKPWQGGKHSLVLKADEKNQVLEMNEGNNTVSLKKDVVSKYPDVYLLSPTSGSVVPTTNLVLKGYATDGIDGVLASTSLDWFFDGAFVGSTTELTLPSLLPGTHQISLKATNSAEFISEKNVTILAVLPTVPYVSIASPLAGQIFSTGVSYSFVGTAEDASDGNLCKNATWISSLDTQLGTGCSIQASLSAGVHTISLSTVNKAGNTSTASIMITVQEGKPKLTLTPLSKSSYYEHESIQFSATALDVQDGLLSNKIQWSSNISGSLGTGAALSKKLTPGSHIISAAVIDSTGQSDIHTVSVLVNYTPPILKITGPTTSTFSYGKSITFSGTALTFIGTSLPEDSMVWESSLQGYMGSGSAFTTASLVPGIHTITFTGKDTHVSASTTLAGLFIPDFCQLV